MPNNAILEKEADKIFTTFKKTDYKIHTVAQKVQIKSTAELCSTNNNSQ